MTSGVPRTQLHLFAPAVAFKPGVTFSTGPSLPDFGDPQPDSGPSIFIGRHEHDAGALKHALDLAKSIDPGVGSIFKAADSIWS
jgi:hypothetical protein